MAQDFKNLAVWQRSVELSVCVYQMTKLFPREELYGLSSQMRRASISIASNIAEGRGRLNLAEFRQFLGLAQGSLFELRTQLEVARRLKMAGTDYLPRAQALCEEVSKMLTSFIHTLRDQQWKKLAAEDCKGDSSSCLIRYTS
jgi:four helix bundle protein